MICIRVEREMETYSGQGEREEKNTFHRVLRLGFSWNGLGLVLADSRVKIWPKQPNQEIVFLVSREHNWGQKTQFRIPLLIIFFNEFFLRKKIKLGKCKIKTIYVTYQSTSLSLALEVKFLKIWNEISFDIWISLC